MKILIIGNSGAGKTYLGEMLSGLLKVPLTKIDDLWFERGKFLSVRPLDDVKKDLFDAVNKDDWIIEGSLGVIIKEVISFCDLLIWLDIPWEECKSNILKRGCQLEDCKVDDETRKIALFNLIEWASTHHIREDDNSHKYFGEIFDKFPRKKLRLFDRDDIQNTSKSIINSL